MEASLKLRQPEHWQDFETLCKKLWGEIWNCPEIQKNGRLGQKQNGVDIYGIPLGEKMYFGIQCKGKDEYTHQQFTEKEIDQEIEKAKTFEPPLKKLYFATTALKDVTIERYIRIKNTENIANGIFEVYLFSWEDIIDLIDENKHTHDWYVLSLNYKTSKSVSVSFQNGLKEITLQPKFKKQNVKYIQKIVPANGVFTLGDYKNQLGRYPKSNLEINSLFSTSYNLSFVTFMFKIQNTGVAPIEDFKIFFDFEGEIQSIATTNEINTGVLRTIAHNSNIILSDEMKNGTVSPKQTILVSEDIFTSDEIYIKVSPVEAVICVTWKLVSKDFKDSGQLKIIIQPNIIIINDDILVDDPFEVKFIQGEIEDMIIDEKEFKQLQERK